MNSTSKANPVKSNPTPSQISSSAILVAAFLLCFLWIVFIRLHTASEPLERDVSTYILMGRVLADGGKMYVDTIEFKPPGMFVIWQVVHQLVGTSPRVIVWINILVTTLTMLGVYLAGSAKPWGRIGGFWAMIFWTLISGDMMLQANQPCNEVFMNMFMIWGIAMWLRADSAQKSQRYYAGAGLLLGLVTLIKQYTLLTMFLMALAWVLADGLNPAALKRRALKMLWVLVPIVILWMLTVLYFVWQGRGTEFYNCLVRYGVFYASNGKQNTQNGNSSIWVNVLHGLGVDLLPTYLYFLAPLMLLTIFGIGVGLRDRPRSQALTLAGCLLGTFFAVSIPGKFFPHYYQLYLPVLAVGAGWGVAASANILQQWVMAQIIGGLALVCLVGHIVPDCQKSGKIWSRIKYGDDFIEFERCGRAANHMLKPDESFYVWGDDPSVYYYSDRRPASGIFWAYWLLYGPSKTWATQKVIADLEKTQPPLILMEEDEKLIPSLDHTALDHPVYQWISARYVESPTTKFSTHFNVYLRRNSALAFRMATNQQPFVLTLADVDPGFLRQTSGELLRQGRTNEAKAYLNRAAAIERSQIP